MTHFFLNLNAGSLIFKKSGTTIEHNLYFPYCFNMLHTQTKPKLGFLASGTLTELLSSFWAPALSSLASGLNLFFWEPFEDSWAVPKSYFISDFGVFLLERPVFCCALLCAGVFCLVALPWALDNNGWLIITPSLSIKMLTFWLVSSWLVSWIHACVQTHTHKGFILFY